MKTEVVVDWIVYERELTTNCFVLFEHERVETKLVTPPRGGKAGGTGANDYDIVHRVAQTVSLRSAPLNRKAVPSPSPTLPFRLRWVNEKIKSYNRNAVASVPNVAFIPFDPMPPEQFPQFILKIDLPMMLLLI